MAKDARGHGSNSRGGSKVYRTIVGHTQVKGQWVPVYSTDTGNEHLTRGGGKPVASNATAANELASGPKSAPAPVHEAMTPHGVKYQPGVTGGALSLHAAYGTDWKKYDKGRGQ